MFPILVSRSIEVLLVKGQNSRISRVFFARFAGGNEKMLREVCWVLTDLLKTCEIGADNVAFLSREDCPLYRLDWSDNPIFGNFKKDYPKLTA